MYMGCMCNKYSYVPLPCRVASIALRTFYIIIQLADLFHCGLVVSLSTYSRTHIHNTLTLNIYCYYLLFCILNEYVMHTLKLYIYENRINMLYRYIYIAIEWRSKGHTSIITFVIMIVAATTRFTQPEWEQNLFYWVLYVVCVVVRIYLYILSLCLLAIAPSLHITCRCVVAKVYLKIQWKNKRLCFDVSEWSR